MQSALTEALGTSPPGDPSGASIIEVLALDKLMPSLRQAFQYILTVAAQRHPSIFLRMHQFRDEVYVAFAAVLEAHSLVRNGASFAEHFYGLRREPSAARPALWRLHLLLLLLPGYLRSKIDGHLAPRVRGVEGMGNGDDSGDSGSTSGGSSSSSGGGSGRLPQDLMRRFGKLLGRLVCATLDAAALVQLLLFMHGSTRHATLTQRLLGYTLQRAPEGGGALPRDAMSSTSALASTLASAPASTPASTPTSASDRLQRLASVAEVPLQQARHLLVLSVFGYRLLEWWHAPENAPPPALKRLPPPPPAGRVLPPPGHYADVAAARLAAEDRRRRLLSQPGLCAVCRMQPREPTAAPSGFVFCAACAMQAVRREGCCPLTGMHVRPQDLIRLYETSQAQALAGADES